MFTISQPEERIIIDSPGQTVEIWPHCGAILNSWIIHQPEGDVELVEGYENEEDFGLNAEAKGFRSAKLSPYVCRLKNASYQWNGTEYVTGGFHLNGAGLHGLLYNKKFVVQSATARDASAEVVLRYEYNNTDQGFPFPFTIVVTYLLEADHRITIETQVSNVGDTDMPLADGWHPYFRLNGTADDWNLSIHSTQQIAFDEELLPTGEYITDNRFLHGASLKSLELDNCFVLLPVNEKAPAAILTTTTGAGKIELYNLKNYPFLQVYIPPNRACIAIENLSSAPDAFNNKIGLITLEGGNAVEFRCMYKYAL